MFSLFATLVFALSFLLVNARGTEELLAFSPTILQPTSDSFWCVGELECVAWETDNVPVEAQNYTVDILLGYLTPEDPENEHLDVDNPLATGVPIMNGNASVIISSDPPCTDNCLVVVIGTSGDISQLFTIAYCGVLSG